MRLVLLYISIEDYKKFEEIEHIVGRNGSAFSFIIFSPALLINCETCKDSNRKEVYS